MSRSRIVAGLRWLPCQRNTLRAEGIAFLDQALPELQTTVPAGLHQPRCFGSPPFGPSGTAHASRLGSQQNEPWQFLVGSHLHHFSSRAGMAILPPLSAQFHTSMPAKSASDTASASSDAAVRNAFAKAGLSDQTSDKVLSRYPCYLRWNVDAKLNPALQQWLQELGPTELPTRLQQNPQLLLSNPAKAKVVSLWLKSQGVDAAQIQDKESRIFARNLSAIQESVSVFREVARFSNEQVPRLLHRHFAALQCEPRRILQSLECVARLLGVPVASDKLRSVVKKRLFRASAVTLERRIMWFCETLGVGSSVAERAIKAGLCSLSEEDMQAKAMKLQTMLHWSQAQLSRILSRSPLLLQYAPDRVAINMQALQTCGFTTSQVLHICTQKCNLLRCNWSSSINIEKLQFCKVVLGLTLDDMAADPSILTYSLTTRLGPRASFLLETNLVDTLQSIPISGRFSSVLYYTDIRFSRICEKMHSDCSVSYNGMYVQQWQRRWSFLRQEMQLPMEAIAAHEQLLFASLPDTLAPRWQVLTQLAAKQADFRAVDHLQALATLSDQDFAKTFSAKEACLA